MFNILNPPPSSLPTPSLWVVPVHQPQASSIVHRTWTGNSFHTRYYTCFSAILPNLPTLSLSNRVHKTVLYISVSAFKYAVYVCHSFSYKEQASFNFLAIVTLCSDLEAQENSLSLSIVSPSI